MVSLKQIIFGFLGIAAILAFIAAYSGQPTGRRQYRVSRFADLDDVANSKPPKVGDVFTYNGFGYGFEEPKEGKAAASLYVGGTKPTDAPIGSIWVYTGNTAQKSAEICVGSDESGLIWKEITNNMPLDA
jgi:hypothetical protein